jgi:hypothetical protein
MGGTPMKSILTRISLLSLCILLFIPAQSKAAAEQRTALVIGNSAYSSGPLKNPVNDAADMAAALQKAGFKVTLKKNASLKDMDDAIENFGNRLKRGGVGLFYFAGHGMQVNGINYLIPIGAKIKKESDVKYEAVDTNRVLDEMANVGNGLNIMMLDACRDNPYARSFRNAARGLAIVSSAPSGTFISYSTGPGQVARDGDGRNSPYSAALIQYMKKPGLTIEDVFKDVRRKLRKETGQVPWELSSLEGKFFFVPGKTSQAKDEENLDNDAEILAMGKRPSVSTANEIKRDGRFIAYDDGTVLDTRTKLMRAARDNGGNINWAEAKSYCENYRGGGYTDWRMPTQEELAGLFDGSRKYEPACGGHVVHVTELIRITCILVWASDVRGSEVAFLGFDYGGRSWCAQSGDYNGVRTLPVRNAK